MINEINDNKIEIRAYKHNGEVHRIWREIDIINQTENEIILANEFSKVVEGDGKNWFTPEPAVSIFYYDEFFNVIAMLKEDGIYFYCNLSSPAIFDKEGIKYIDYDLDLRVLPDFTYEILDEDEFLENIVKYNYPEDLQKVLKITLNNLIEKVKEGELPFNHKYIEDLYMNFINKKNNN